MPYEFDKDEYVPPKVSGYFPTDLSNIGAQPFLRQYTRRRPKYTTRSVYRDEYGEIIQWRIMVEDLRGGISSLRGDFTEVYDQIAGHNILGYANSGEHYLYTADEGKAYLPTALVEDTVWESNPPSDDIGFHSAYIYSLLHLATGSEANNALLRETDDDDPTLVKVTYSPGSSITSLSVAALASSLPASPMLFVGRESAGVQMLTDAYAVHATMHSDTTLCWGIIQTPTLTPDHPDPLLIYANGTLMSLDSDAGETTQPTTVLTGVPNGGWALGLGRIGGGAYKAFWVWPKDNLTTGLIDAPFGTGARVVSTNLEGTAYEEVPTGLNNVYQAILFNATAIVATDRSRVTYYDGRTAARELPLFNNFLPDSDMAYNIDGLGGFGHRLLLSISRRNNQTGGTVQNLYVYDLETERLSVIGTHSTGGLRAFTGAIPYSDSTQYLYTDVTLSSGAISRLFFPRANTSLYTSFNKTENAGSTHTVTFEANAGVLLPAYILPGLEGWPKTVSRIIFLGDVDAGGTTTTAATVSFYIFPPNTAYSADVITTTSIPSVTFTTGQRNRAQVAEWTDQSLLYDIQIGITASRHTGDAFKTPNVLPFIVEGYCYIENPRPPQGFLTDVM